MNKGRMLSMLNNLTGVQRRVFDAVPISEFWTITQICDECRRLYSTSPNFAQVESCVKTMQEQGLIIKLGTHYQRVKTTNNPIPEIIEPKKETMAVNNLKPIVEQKPATIAEQLLSIAGQLQTLSDDMSRLASDVEKAINVPNAELIQLRELRTVLSKMMAPA